MLEETKTLESIGVWWKFETVTKCMSRFNCKRSTLYKFFQKEKENQSFQKKQVEWKQEGKLKTIEKALKIWVFPKKCSL